MMCLMAWLTWSGFSHLLLSVVMAARKDLLNVFILLLLLLGNPSTHGNYTALFSHIYFGLCRLLVGYFPSPKNIQFDLILISYYYYILILQLKREGGGEGVPGWARRWQPKQLCICMYKSELSCICSNAWAVHSRNTNWHWDWDKTKLKDEARVSYIVLASSSCSEVLRSTPSQLGDACSMQVFPAGMAKKGEKEKEEERERGRLVYCPSMSAQCPQG